MTNSLLPFAIAYLAVTALVAVPAVMKAAYDPDEPPRRRRTFARIALASPVWPVMVLVVLFFIGRRSAWLITDLINIAR